MAVGCDNMTGYHQKSFFRIPNPYKLKDNKDQFAKKKERKDIWLYSLKRRFTTEKFKFGRTGFCVKITSRNPCLKRR